MSAPGVRNNSQARPRRSPSARAAPQLRSASSRRPSVPEAARPIDFAQEEDSGVSGLGLLLGRLLLLRLFLLVFLLDHAEERDDVAERVVVERRVSAARGHQQSTNSFGVSATANATVRSATYRTGWTNSERPKIGLNGKPNSCLC